MEAVDVFKPIRDRDTGHVKAYEKESVENFIEQQKKEQARRDGYIKLKRHEEAQSKDQRHFYKVFDNGGNAIKEAELADLGVLFRLTTNLYYEGAGLLAQGKGSDGKLKPLKKADLMRLLDKSKNGINAAITRLESMNIIRKVKNGRSINYYVSEDIISFGQGTGSGYFTKLYKTKAQQKLKKLTDSEAGLIFKCLPYIHYSTHLLVMRPYEKDLSKLNAIRGEALANKLGIERKSFNNLTSKLKRKGAMMFLDVGTQGKGYAIDPSLCDRGYKSEFSERVQAYFTALEDK